MLVNHMLCINEELLSYQLFNMVCWLLSENIYEEVLEIKGTFSNQYMA